MSLLRLEWRRLCASPWPWVLLALAVGLLGWMFLQLVSGFLAAQTKLAALPSAPGYTDLVAVPLLSQLAQAFLLLAPLLLMSAIAGERRHGTLPPLLASGRSPQAIVLAKFFSGWLWLLLLLALTVAMPLLLAGATQPDWGKLAAATLGLALLGAALAAIALACSAATRQPALAAGLAWLIGVGLWFVNRPLRVAGERGGPIDWLALPTHLQPMLRGVVASRDVVYFLLLVAVALAIASLRLAHERERG